jgi:hypothetical protein
MARAPVGHEVGGGETHKRVKIRPEWEAAIESAIEESSVHHNSRKWTDEENAFLLKARKAGMKWKDVGKCVGCNEATARKQWLVLQ